MTDNDIVRWALEAGGRIEHIGIDIAWLEFMPENLERFAVLVAAAEREECAKVCAADGLLWGQRYAAAIRARGQA